MEEATLEKLVSLCKRRGFIYHGSEIYGGLSGFWDYGPLGVELKNNIKKQWWQEVVYEREDVVGIDGAIIMNPNIWQASGHTQAFTDWLVECKACHKRYRADHFQKAVEEFEKGNGTTGIQNVSEEARNILMCQGKEINKFHARSDMTSPKTFNLLTEAFLG